MTTKPTHASVTTEPCTCKYLERAADEPENPIVFHQQTGEFHFSYTDPADGVPQMLIIYHCPFCGGAAPPSKRETLFHVVPHAESNRLLEILHACKNLDDVFATFGQPDQDTPAGSSFTTFEDKGSPPQVVFQRLLIFQNVSDVADLHITERPDGMIGYSVVGKLKKDG